MKMLAMFFGVPKATIPLHGWYCPHMPLTINVFHFAYICAFIYVSGI